ncbi:Swi3-domain-containing protein [Ramaria rubella]|nr:Swi3-domain-containing protein [Ramaria rubella]
MSLDDIWSEPAVEIDALAREPTDVAETRPRSRPALFLSDSEDDNAGIANTNRASPLPASPPRNSDVPQAPEKSQLDVLFAGLDDDDPFKDIAPAIDVEKLKRQADAKRAAARSREGGLSSTATASIGDGSSSVQNQDEKNEGKKTKMKRVMPKLDEERLLGHDGFPRLIKEHKSFKVTGKGHEAADLERLFRIYHAWTHKMYPKFQFRDTVDRVEKLCRSRRMAVNLKVWRDEVHGITAEVGHEVTLDSENEDPNGNIQPAQEAPSPSSRPATPATRPSSALSIAPSVPSSPTDCEDDMDIDALLREEEQIMREMNGAQKGSSAYKPSTVDDEDALWVAAGGVPDDPPETEAEAPEPMKQASNATVDDEEMWNILDEMEARSTTTKADGDAAMEHINAEATRNTVAPVAPEQPTIGADWDDMYEDHAD